MNIYYVLIFFLLLLLTPWFFVTFKCPRCGRRMKHLGFSTVTWCQECGLVIRPMDSRKG